MINKKNILYFILIIIIASIILMFSSQSSKISNGLSYKIDIKIYNFLYNRGENTKQSSVDLNNKAEVNKLNNYPINDKRFRDIDFIVRKTAHVTLYALLATCITLFLKSYNIKNIYVIFIVLILCFLYACIDEVNQKLGGTRTGKFTD